MRWALVAGALSVLFVPAGQARLPVNEPGGTRIIRIAYRAHDGRRRPAWLLVPAGDVDRPIPLIVSPHDRGETARANALRWGDLPGEGDFAVINPGGEGRRLGNYSWGDPGQIGDLARMPSIAAANGVDVDLSRVYAVGGSMGGQETLLLVARDPQLLAGAIGFDPATDMARRYRDFAALKDGRELQYLARLEIGGPPAQVPAAYAERSPDHYAGAIADSAVPLQLYWSTRDRVIRDQRLETGALVQRIRRYHPEARLWVFVGEWRHTAEMRASRRLPRALARFDLLPWADVPPLPSSRRPAY